MKTGDIFSGRYRLLEKIGVGGYAQVWKAVDMMADDAVLAIKIFAADNGLDADGLKQFRREYALVLNLNHANLLTARHFDVWEGRPYLIMPYIEHGSLASRLLREGPMNEAELIDLIRQLSEALAYLHENDILHQDIKPDNVLIGPKGRYLLMDFGISSRLKSTLRKSTGSVGTMTVAYGPPERFDAQPKQLPAGDVFSLGVLAYEMATGDVPWMGNGGMSLKIGAEIPDLPEWYSESFKRLFRRMLSLGPDSRPSSSEINKAIRQKSTGTESGSTKKNLRVTERITPESSSYRETHNEIQSDPIESRRKTNSASGLKLVIGLFVGFIAIVILINLGGNEPIMPTVSTFAPYSITQNSAVSGGYITIENGAIAITERGVVWSTNQNPTITSNSGKTMNGRGTGSFASNMTGLNAGTTYYVRAYATNSAGTSYGEQRSFTTTAAVTLPALSTNTLSSITQNSAVSGGNITADGGAAVTSRGVVWSTSQNPTIASSSGRTTNGSGTGSYTSSLSGLSPGTTYYIRAYATNSTGTQYGPQRSFTTTAAVTLPALSTNTLSSITQNSAVSGGNITADGGAAVTSRGVVWSTSQNPTIASNSGRTTNGSGTGSYTSSLSGLSPGTTYYIRAYATNSAGTAYGQQRSFTTQSARQSTPTIGTSPVISIMQNSAVSGGNITADGGAAVTARGVVWSTSQNPTIASNSGRTTNGNGTGIYTSILTGLSPRTTYYVRAYATNSSGTHYGNQVNFTTQSARQSIPIPIPIPTISTSPVVSITQNSAVSGGNVTADGGAAVTSRGVVWSTSQNPTIASNSGRTTNGNGTGIYTSILTGLSPRTTYYVRAYATNSAGTQYGEQRSFSTQSVVPISSGRDTQTAVVNVTNSRTGRVWMDRNLGASRSATSSNDTQAYGDLYQWGRAADGHEKRNSTTTTTLSSGDQPGHGSFILSNSGANRDWRSPQNNNLWQGVNGINNPCPVGYRLPTEAEWEAERRSWSSNNAAGAFASPLKLPLAGYRDGSSGSLFRVGSGGYYWSGSVSGANARRLNFSSSSANVYSSIRALGYSVRCLRD
jgi:uncharacterized protein (TIGR02145 family)